MTADEVIDDAKQALEAAAAECPTEEAPVTEPPAESPPADPPVPKDVAIGNVQAKLVEQLRIFRDAEADWREAHNTAGEMKKAMDREQRRLNGYVNELADIIEDRGGPRLPFPDENAPPPPVEEWRKTTIEDLGITGALAETLVEAGLKTLGDITDHTKDGKPLTDIQGIGPAKAEKISDLCAKYWETHPVPSEEAA